MPAARTTLDKAHSEVEPIKGSLEAAVTGYRKIFSSADMKDDKKAERDFDDCLAYTNRPND